MPDVPTEQIDRRSREYLLGAHEALSRISGVLLAETFYLSEGVRRGIRVAASLCKRAADRTAEELARVEQHRKEMGDHEAE